MKSQEHGAFFRKPLSFYYQNVRSIKTENKFLTFKSNLQLRALPIDVIVLTETWLCEENDPSSTDIEGYTVYRNDRNNEASNKSKGGGVMIAVNKKIISSPIYTDDPAVEQPLVKR